MKWVVKIVVFVLLLSAGPVWGAEYYMRSDGTAANKAAATGPGTSQSACMSIATHNSQTFAAGDIIYLCDDGGKFLGRFIIPSDGSEGSVILYTNELGDSPVLDANGESYAFSYTGRSYITAQNFMVSGGTSAAVGGSSATRITLNNIRGTSGLVGIYCSDGGSHIHINGCTMSGFSRQGFYFINSPNTQISQSSVTDCGTVGQAYQGVRLIDGCIDFFLDGVTVSGQKGTAGSFCFSATSEAGVSGIVQNCEVANPQSGNYYGFRLAGDDKARDVIYFKNCIDDGSYTCFHLQDDGGKMYIYNCTGYTDQYAHVRSVTDSGDREIVIRNSIFSGTPDYHFAIDSDNVSIDSDYDDYYGATENFCLIDSVGTDYAGFKTNNGGGDANSIVSDPLFVNAGAGNFHLQSGSPCKDAGTDVGIDYDFDGNPRWNGFWIGAYEFQVLEPKEKGISYGGG